MCVDRDTKAAVRLYLKEQHPALYEFWLAGGPDPSVSIQDYCDVLYTLYLLGDGADVSRDAADTFVRLIQGMKLPGVDFGGASATVLSVHNFAYLLGALNILRDLGIDRYPLVFKGARLRVEEIIDTGTLRPLFPVKFTHHGWRVSHWLGGVPSILLSLSRSGSELAAPAGELFEKVLDAVNESLIDRRTGFIKAYKSDFLQTIFKLLYGVRHDPHLGDIGGVSHIIWVNHARGKLNVNSTALFAASKSEFMARRPFMEKVPYCLDFDVVQMVRTTGMQIGADFAPLKARAQAMIDDIAGFMNKGDWNGYALHKMPGALATYHEAALITSSAQQNNAVDIVQVAYWL